MSVSTAPKSGAWCHPTPRAARSGKALPRSCAIVNVMLAISSTSTPLVNYAFQEVPDSIRDELSLILRDQGGAAADSPHWYGILACLLITA